VKERQRRGKGAFEGAEVLQRERKFRRKAKWLYRKASKLGEKVMIIEAAKNQSNQ
jgi:hypothetical protein